MHHPDRTTGAPDDLDRQWQALPEDNVFGLPAGTATAISDGNAVIVKPLPPGRHRVAIHIEAGFVGVVDLIYDLTVVPRGQAD